MRKTQDGSDTAMTLPRPKTRAALMAVLVMAVLLPALAARAFDISDLPIGARGKLGFPGMGDMGNEEGSPFGPGLANESIPFVGDFPLVDTEYVVGPGDVFQIFYETTVLEKQVNPEGNILLSRLGPIKVGDKTLKEGKKAVLDKLQAVYKKSECFVNLARPKKMRVFVTGAVNTPGAFEVAGNTRLSDLLNLAQGFAPMARRGEISIVAPDGSVKTANLRHFYMDGKLDHNPYLPQGGFVQMPFLDYSQPWVTIRRDTLLLPIQLEPGETLMDLMQKFNSFRAPPPISSIMVKEAGGKPRIVAPSEVQTFIPAAGSQVEILPQFRDIFVGGAVARPGFQPYRSNRSVLHYISEAGLLTSSKVSDLVDVTRSSGKREQLSVKGGILYPGDMVYVDQNREQRFIIYTPILLSLASLTLAIISITR